MDFASRIVNDVISLMGCDNYWFSFHQMGKYFTTFSFANYANWLTVYHSIHSRILTNLEQVILDLKKKKFEDGGLYIVCTSLHPEETTVLPFSVTFPGFSQL